MRFKKDILNADNIDFDYYQGKDVEIPKKEDFKKYFLYNKGKVIFEGNKFEKYEFINSNKDVSYVEELVFDEEEYKKLKKEKTQIIDNRKSEYLDRLYNDTDLQDFPYLIKKRIIDYIKNNISENIFSYEFIDSIEELVEILNLVKTID